ncbi:MAG TPA: proton-conducting transporter membrane subunit, partial [Armatimonadota bacterium]|nr:proton-conducting transporter membrane subunit [Armatimonadota bacterium]
RDRRGAGWVALGFVAVAAALAATVALPILITGHEASYLSGFAVPGLGAELTFTVDALSALFLILIVVGALIATLYSIDYMESYPEQNLARYYGPLLLFIAGMIGVVCVADWFFFLIFWEFMTLASYFLVVFERENPVNLRAGFKYFLMTHAASALMFAAAIITWKAGPVHQFGFASAQVSLAGMAQARPWLLHLVLAMWLIGFGTKAGMYPFGDWLPDAYPAAPSSATAVFSGVMSKMGVYGIARVFLWHAFPALSADAVVAWGLVIAAFGVASAVIGSIAAVQQNDCKRLLAFSSIGQMGYILMGLGVGLAFLRLPAPGPLFGALALLAAFYHLVNDAAFKSLLFLNAGSIVYVTGTRDLNRVGGLAAVMPVAAVTAGVGALALAGLPPLNGFVSKWMLYHASIVGGLHYPVFLAVGLIALMVSVVSLAYAMKFVGIAFMGKPAAIAGGRGRGLPWTMTTAQVLLAAVCVALGLAPVWVARAIYGMLQAPGLELAAPAQILAGSNWTLQLVAGRTVAAAAWNPLLLLGLLAGLMVVSYGIMRLGGAPVRVVGTWYCGEEHADELVRFRAQGVFAPFNRAFAGIYPRVRLPRVALPGWVPRVFDLDSWLYAPLVRGGGRLAERLSRTHVGIPQIYMLWQVIGVIVVLALLFLVVRG